MYMLVVVKQVSRKELKKKEWNNNIENHISLNCWQYSYSIIVCYADFGITCMELKCFYFKQMCSLLVLRPLSTYTYILIFLRFFVLFCFHFSIFQFKFWYSEIASFAKKINDFELKLRYFLFLICFEYLPHISFSSYAFFCLFFSCDTTI